MQRESVTFGIYSCEWTKMDLNFRKTVLLAMRMNDVNQLAIQFSPTKVVNVQMCSGVNISHILKKQHRIYCFNRVPKLINSNKNVISDHVDVI